MSGSTAGASLTEIKNIKLAGNVKFLSKDKKSKLQESIVKNSKISEEELQENTFIFKNMKAADKASAKAMKYPKNHKDSEEAYTHHSDAHDAAMIAAGRSSYGYDNAMGGPSLKTKKKYLDMASMHLDHMIHHTNKEFGESVSESDNNSEDKLKEINMEEGWSKGNDTEEDLNRLSDHANRASKIANKTNSKKDHALAFRAHNNAQVAWHAKSNLGEDKEKFKKGVEHRHKMMFHDEKSGNSDSSSYGDQSRKIVARELAKRESVSESIGTERGIKEGKEPPHVDMDHDNMLKYFSAAKNAHERSKEASENDSPTNHHAAMQAHKKASKKADIAGFDQLKDHHDIIAQHHANQFTGDSE